MIDQFWVRYKVHNLGALIPLVGGFHRGLANIDLDHGSFILRAAGCAVLTVDMPMGPMGPM